MSAPNIEQLWNQLHSRLFLYIRRHTTNEADAEDILQEVFLRIHTHLDSVRDMERLESWIYQIARNAIVDFHRKPNRLEPYIESAVEDERSEPDVPQELAHALREAVEALPEPYREALLLTEYRGLSQKVLADQLGISISGAKSRVQRARQKIRDQLLACCHFYFDARGLVCCYRERCCCCNVE